MPVMPSVAGLLRYHVTFCKWCHPTTLVASLAGACCLASCSMLSSSCSFRAKTRGIVKLSGPCFIGFSFGELASSAVCCQALKCRKLAADHHGPCHGDYVQHSALGLLAGPSMKKCQAAPDFCWPCVSVLVIQYLAQLRRGLVALEPSSAASSQLNRPQIVVCQLSPVRAPRLRSACTRMPSWDPSV